MSKYYLAAVILSLLSLSAIVSIVIGAMASLAGRPGEEAMTELGHRAVAWVGALCGLGVLGLLMLERVTR